MAAYEEALATAYEEAIPDATGMSDLQKARALHDYLVQHMTYDYTFSNYDAYGALVEGTAVCEGYSLAYAALLQRAGIEFDFCESEDMNHMWNYVKIDGEWYHVDVTWDDPYPDHEGSVSHQYFLVSDEQIASEGTSGHYNWTGERTCTDTTYDGAYWQEDLSAIFYIDGSEYYLKAKNPGTSKQQVTLVRRTNDVETIMCTVPAVWNVWGQSGWWNMIGSSLSYNNGLLYFNDKLNIYEIVPGETAMRNIYTYSKGDGYIYGSLVCGENITIDVTKNPNEEAVTSNVPLPDGPISEVTLTADLEQVEYGYTTSPVLTAEVTKNADATGVPTYRWFKIITDGEGNLVEVEIPEADNAVYTVETGLSPGSYQYRVSAKLNGYTKNAKITIEVRKMTGAVQNKVSEGYVTTYTYSGKSIPKPDASQFTTNAGAIHFSWYQGEKEISAEPKNAGEYILHVEANETAHATSAVCEIPVTITPATISVQPKEQTIVYGEKISSDVSDVEISGLVGEDALSSVVLEQSTQEETDAGNIRILELTIRNDQEDVTANYQIQMSVGNLVIEKKPEIEKAVVYRISGATRYETSYAIADAFKAQLKVEKFSTVILADGQNFPDALAGSYLAGMKNAPILMVNKKNPEPLKTYIRENLESGGTIYVLGGTEAVPEDAVSGLTGYEIKRLAGQSRYETNLKILQEAGYIGNEILVCTGRGFADSLSASATGKPILLVGKALTDEQRAFLQKNNGKSYYINGGTGVVSEEFENIIQQYGEVKRIFGATRYETSLAVAKEFFDVPDTGILAYAKNFPDGLCGGPLAMSKNAPLILTATGKQDFAVAYASENGMKSGAVLGGDGLISEDAAKEIFGAVSIEIW